MQPPATIPVTAYLQRDGTFCYRLNSTARTLPYSCQCPQCVSIIQQPPFWGIWLQSCRRRFGNCLAMVLAMAAAVGCFLFFQQVIMRNLKSDSKPLYRYQQGWIFCTDARVTSCTFDRAGRYFRLAMPDNQ
jgi:hypothetical protein